MSASDDDDYHVGYQHPPRETRWKKGQSGNPQHRRRKRTESAGEIVDRLLFEPVEISVNGEIREVSAIEAILLRLLQQALAGSVDAYRVLQAYAAFAAKNSEERLEITYLDNDYSRAVSSREVDGDE
jgi:hypothetical protein